jgi:hypothetical protein
MNEKDVTRLIKILIRAHGPVVGQGKWRTRTNQELREL